MKKQPRQALSRREFLKQLAQGATSLAASFLAHIRCARPVEAAAPQDEAYPHHVYLPLAMAHQRAHGPSKLGVHTVLPNNAAGFVQSVHEAGAHVALVKATDDFGYLRSVKDVSPETVVVARSTCVQSISPSGDPASAASWVMSEHMPYWAYEKDVVDYWEVLNENDPPTLEGHVWLAEFYKAAMAIAEANGYRLALFSYSVGVPEWAEWEAIVGTGVFAHAQAGGHILALHEYNWPTMDDHWGESLPGKPIYPDRGPLAGRYRHLYRDFLVPYDQTVPLAITECGLDPVLWEPGEPTNRWQDRFVDEMIWYDTRLREDDYVIGAAMFTLGGAWGWEDYDYEALLPDFRNHIVSLKDA